MDGRGGRIPTSDPACQLFSRTIPDPLATRASAGHAIRELREKVEDYVDRDVALELEDTAG
jgi:hypothetical protein